MNNIEIGLFNIDSFPKLHWSMPWNQREGLIQIAMMLPGEINTNMVPLGQYNSQVWIAKDISEKLDEIKKRLPADYVENLKNDMLKLQIKDGKRITRKTPHEFMMSMKEVREAINTRCLQDMLTIDVDPKVKNLFLATVRYALGKEFDDVSGD